jgi:hypothetical protein
MFSHIFSKRKSSLKFKDLLPKLTKLAPELKKNKPEQEKEKTKASPGNETNQINTTDINYKEYDQVHSLCMRVIVYFVSKYVIVYDIKT